MLQFANQFQCFYLSISDWHFYCGLSVNSLLLTPSKVTEVCRPDYCRQTIWICILVESIAGKNVSPSDKKLWRFSKNVLVAEKSQCKALSIGFHLEISSLLLMSAENTETLSFVSLKFCFLGFVHRHNELFFSYLWSFICKFLCSEEMRIRVDEEITPTHYNRFMAGFVCAEVCVFKVISL